VTVLITGATGFVGRQLLHQLASDSSVQLRAAIRNMVEHLPADVSVCKVGQIDAETDWHEALADCKTVIHTAGRAHVLNDIDHDSLSAYRSVNVEGSLNLARQAIDAGVKRFIFISSIKVNGEGETNRVYRFDDPAAPEDDYGLSKWEAEQALRTVCSVSSMELVIIRPPLIYGPGVKGNLALLCKAIDKRLPLPLGSIKNQRDMLSLNNLIDLIKTCIRHPAAAGQVFLCSDNEPVSTPQLIKMMANSRGANARLWPMPISVLSMVAFLIGRQGVLKRLSSDFRVDIKHTMTTLDWIPPFSVAESMRWAFAKKL
jgi:nucleoside-diphosphate-sugar epimerase